MIKEYPIRKAFFDNYPNGKKWKELKNDIEDKHDILPSFMRARQLEDGNLFKPTIGGKNDKYLNHIQYLTKAIDAKFYTLNPTIAAIIEDSERMIDKDNKVLLLGESGVGKELLVKVIANHLDLLKDDGHYKHNFIAVNCASLEDSLSGSELFGHKKDAFTGATKDKLGKVDAAKNGVLFLDEIHFLPIITQRKLLRFLDSGEYTPIGGTETKFSNAKIILASNKDLKDPQIRKDLPFLDDLYWRISVPFSEFTIPPLRERRSDIPFMIMKISQEQSAYVQKRDQDKNFYPGISDPLLAALMIDPLNGNGRTLRRIIEYLWIFEGENWFLRGDKYFLHKNINVKMDMQEYWGQGHYIDSSGKVHYEKPVSGKFKFESLTRGKAIEYLIKIDLVKFMKNYSLPQSVVQKIEGKKPSDSPKDLSSLAHERTTLDDIKGLYCLEVEKDRGLEDKTETIKKLGINFKTYMKWFKHGKKLELKEKV